MKVSQAVEHTLKNNVGSRSSDKQLILAVWETYGFYLSASQALKFMDLPSPETIRRIRQKIQEEGKYPANEGVRRHRSFKSLQVQQSIPSVEADKVDELINNRLFDLPPKRRII